jgi:hypothetical protein
VITEGGIFLQLPWSQFLPMQVYDLEKKGGSIIAGVLKLMQERKANPPPPRDARLPPKPAGQTVGSFRAGLQMLPEAIARNLQQHIRSVFSSSQYELHRQRGFGFHGLCVQTYQLVICRLKFDLGVGPQIHFGPALHFQFALNMAMHGC